MSKYENKVLSNDIIEQICIDIICSKLYKPTVISRNAELKKIFDSKNTFTKKQAKDILKSSPQKHKEAGFDKGWPSRFDTWYKFIKEMGFCYYEIGSKIEISEIGKELINAYDANPINNQIIENIFLNSMVKFQTSTPFRMNAIKNIPLLLLLRVIKLLKEKGEDKGIHRKEISFFICWNNNNAEELCDYILKFRKKYGFKCSEDIIYEKCLNLFLDDNNNDINSLKTYIKKDKITNETVDEYIRKMRITGVISLRGNGCFLDINTLKKDKINYILDKYGDCCNITDKYEYYKYISERDNNLLEVKTSFTDTTSAKQKILFDLAQIYTDKKLKEELKNTYSKRNTTNDELLKYLDAPVRLEFLASIALVKYFKNITVIPNYSSDDEGIPTFTAKGGGGDIEFYNNKYYSLLEVTLMTGAAN
ncbi:MAG: AlwI family type II restriction endonuclease [Abditibacteriota bacterium]|nr:AlwI family type II restriction endonuclease [Abditibacteriota bacterium]